MEIRVSAVLAGFFPTIGKSGFHSQKADTLCLLKLVRNSSLQLESKSFDATLCRQLKGQGLCWEIGIGTTRMRQRSSARRVANPLAAGSALLQTLTWRPCTCTLRWGRHITESDMQGLEFGDYGPSPNEGVAADGRKAAR